MSGEGGSHPGERVKSPQEELVRILIGLWRDLKSIYYANSVSWRLLKSGALLFFGFFLWSSANLLLSYQPAWRWLTYVMAYGFVLILYGPFTHLVMVPLTIRIRRTASSGTTRFLGRHLTKINLTVFFLIVIALGAVPPDVMMFTFSVAAASGGAVDVSPTLLCTASGPAGERTIHCHLSSDEGIDSVVVESGGERVLVDEEPPFDFTVQEEDLNAVMDQKQFQVVLRDDEGDVIRRYTRTVQQIR